jgi:dihydrolipoamide dehydrogenase
MKKHQHDLVVIGAGPGGYVAAIRAAQLGLNVACVDTERSPGGTCLRIGCIPSKALLESSARYHETVESLSQHGVRTGKVTLDLAAMLKRKDDIVKTLIAGVEGLLKKNKVARYTGHGRFDDKGSVLVKNKAGTVRLAARHIIIATGSKPARLDGVKPDGDRIGVSTEALAYAKPPAHLVVIGAGYIGLELGSVWRRLGTKVTVVELLDRILPGMDGELAAEALNAFKKQGIEFRLGCRVSAARARGKTCVVETETTDPIKCDRVLVAVGRAPNTDDLGLDAIGVKPDKHGRIPVNDRFATAAEGVYAIGDVIAGPMLAHKAAEEAIACVEGIVTGQAQVNYDAIPAVVYTAPEIAGVGRTEEQLRDSDRPYRKGVFPFRANARARALGAADGRVKLLADKTTDRILGVHIIGPSAGELVAEAAAAIAFGASSEDLARVCHAHPTLAETVREAALAADNRALHI